MTGPKKKTDEADEGKEDERKKTSILLARTKRTCTRKGVFSVAMAIISWGQKSAPHIMVCTGTSL